MDARAAPARLDLYHSRDMSANWGPSIAASTSTT